LYGFLAILAAPLLAADLTGRVTAVSDGDTLTLLVPDGASFKQVKVRLGEIDTPERKQPYGTRAQQVLSDLAYNKQARVVVQDTDKYGRTVGRVYVGGVDVNAERVKRGAAWVYRQFLKDQSLLTLEAEAKAAQHGLWGPAGSAALPALGLAEGDLRHCLGPDDRCAGGSDRHQQRRFHLRRQAVLPGNDELRGSEVLPDAMQGAVAGWQP
jgi:endonuclease YncB( thermonuclease family)